MRATAAQATTYVSKESKRGAALALAFFACVVTLVPLGVGADLKLLARIAGGVLWVAAVLAALLALDRLFQADYEDGSLDLIALSPLPLEVTALANMPSREQLLATLLGTMQAPITQFVRTLNEVPTKFVRGLAAVRDAKETA